MEHASVSTLEHSERSSGEVKKISDMRVCFTCMFFFMSRLFRFRFFHALSANKFSKVDLCECAYAYMQYEVVL